MNFTSLEYFMVTAKYEHITKAARELHISQPALSHTIRNLEEELGVPLFDRIGTGIKLNYFGAEYLKYVKTILYNVEDGTKRIREMAGKECGRIAFSTPESLILSKRQTA